MLTYILAQIKIETQQRRLTLRCYFLCLEHEPAHKNVIADVRCKRKIPEHGSLDGNTAAEKRAESHPGL